MRFRWLAVALLCTVALMSSCDQKPAEAGFGTTNVVDHGLEGKIYFLPNTTRKLPDFTQLKPQDGSIYAATLNVPPTSWTKGFPGITDRFEWFAIVYTSTMHALQAGHYKFRSVSDDGSKIYIDDKLIVNDDGLHPVSSVAGVADLDTAPHRFRVEYMQGPRYSVALQVYCTEPGGKEVLFPGCGLALETPGSHFCWVCWLLLLLLLLIITEEIWRRRRKKENPASIPNAPAPSA